MKSLHLSSIKACSLLSVAFAATAQAHEGHGAHADAFDGLLHWFTEWDHLAVVVVVGAIAVLLLRRARHSKSTRAAQAKQQR